MSIKSVIIREIMEEFGVTEEMEDKVKSIIDNDKIEVARSDFKTLVESINNKNKMKPYPDINNVPK